MGCAATTREPVVVFWEDDPARSRAVAGFCRVCYPHGGDGQVVMLVSPTGLAHHGDPWHTDETWCGHEATGPEWWWRS